MLEKELTDIWKNSSQEEKSKFEVSRMILELRNNLNYIENTILKGEKQEIAVAILGILFFEYSFFEMSTLFIKVATVLGVIWLGLAIFRLTHNQKNTLPITLSFCFLEQLENEKAYLLQQTNLLDTAPYWYALFPFIITTLFILGLGSSNQYDWSYFTIRLASVSPILNIITLIIAGLFYGLIAWIYKRQLKKEIPPIIKNIEDLLFILENDEVV